MRKIKRKMLLVVMFISASIFCFYAFTFAKYISNSVWDYHLRSKGFHFSSDYLGTTEIKNSDSLWDGNSVSFNIRNNLNDTVATGYDINYSVSCSIVGPESTYTECEMNGTGTNSATGTLSSYYECVNTTGDEVDVSAYDETACTTGGYSWDAQTSTKDLFFDVNLTDLQETISEATVSVIATSTSPYAKTLSGEFKLHKSTDVEGSIVLSYDNYSNYDRLTISNSYSIGKCITVMWNADNLVLDEDSTIFNSYSTDINDYINEVEINLDPKSNESYRFYSRDFTTTYDDTEFSVVESCN